MDKEALRLAWQQHGKCDGNWYPQLLYPYRKAPDSDVWAELAQPIRWKAQVNQSYLMFWLWLHTIKCIVCILLGREGLAHTHDGVTIAMTEPSAWSSLDFMSEQYDWYELVVPVGWRNWNYDWVSNGTA